MPAAGWLGDRFGRRRIYLFGIAAFVVFSIVVSSAWDASSLIAFRVSQAVAGGLVPPTGLAIVNRCTCGSRTSRTSGPTATRLRSAPLVVALALPVAFALRRTNANADFRKEPIVPVRT